MAKQVSVYTQQTPDGEVRATNVDLLRAVTELVQGHRPCIEDLVAAVTLAWADDPAAV
jgi:phosphohistidine phosphatase SixA